MYVYERSSWSTFCERGDNMSCNEAIILKLLFLKLLKYTQKKKCLRPKKTKKRPLCWWTLRQAKSASPPRSKMAWSAGSEKRKRGELPPEIGRTDVRWGSLRHSYEYRRFIPAPSTLPPGRIFLATPLASIDTNFDRHKAVKSSEWNCI